MSTILFFKNLNRTFLVLSEMEDLFMSLGDNKAEGYELFCNRTANLAQRLACVS